MENLTIRKAEQDSSSVSQSLTQSKRSLHNVYEWLQKVHPPRSRFLLSLLGAIQI